MWERKRGEEEVKMVIEGSIYKKKKEGWGEWKINKEWKMWWGAVNKSKWHRNILQGWDRKRLAMLSGQNFHNPPIPASQGAVCPQCFLNYFFLTHCFNVGLNLLVACTCAKIWGPPLFALSCFSWMVSLRW